MKDFKDMTPDEQREYMEAMTEADRRNDYYKTHEKPRTLKQQLLDYETDHRIC